MAYPRVAGFSSVIPLEHHRHHTLHAAWRFVSKSSLSHHSKTNQPLSLAYRCTAEHGSTGAGPHELFSSGLHGPPPMSLIRAWGRDHTLIPSCKAHAEKSLAGEYASLPNKDRVARIRKQLLEPELSPSPYDTAWVAMVSLPGSPNVPCFPQCVEWILQNQRDNGSWGINEFDPSANKGILSSALACVIALKKWNVGSEHLRRGLHFIGRNFSVVLDEQITAPIGFNITFPGMLSLAIGMGLEFPISQSRIDEILHLREMELKRQAGEDSHGEQAYMAYIVEGLGNLQDWDKVMKFQRRNGSLFNSPSATAATLIYNYDDKALQYLISLVTEFGSAVPTLHPLKLHCQISIVDSLERTGLSQHFSSEIKGILDITYRLWLQRDDEIILDVATCAMAFRLLRMNGYDVSSDELSHISEASTFHNSLQGYLNETKPILELYKASKVGLSEEDLILDNIGHWSSSLLKEMLSSSEVQTTPTLEQVEYALKFPFYATLDRLDHRRNIEYYDAGGSQMLKAEYLPSHVHQDILALAVEDFNFSQSMYQNELQHLDSWLKENRLDQLQFARQKLSYCYLSAASTIFTPELFDARISWCKSATLAGIVDDLFDVGGSKEELKNLIALVEKWDEHHTCEFYSEQVKIVFYALYTTVNHLGAMASAIQGRDVTEHLREIWLQLIRSHMTEAEWKWNKYVPTMEEYMTNGFVSFACGPILFTPMYFVGQKLSDYIVKHQESNELFRLMSTCGRLLNDIKGFERDEEGNEAKLNNVSLLVLHSGGSMSIKEAKREMQKPIDTSRRDLIRLVLRDRSVVPRPCKELFWNMCKICHVYYSRTDGYSSPNEMAGAVNAVIIEPLKLQHRNTPSAIPSES